MCGVDFGNALLLQTAQMATHLSFESLSRLNTRRVRFGMPGRSLCLLCAIPRSRHSLLARPQEELKKQHVEYLSAHPELRHLLNDFMSAVLMEKPTDVYAFAQSHFAGLQSSGDAQAAPPTSSSSD